VGVFLSRGGGGGGMLAAASPLLLKSKSCVLTSVIIRFVIPVVFIIKLDWSVCICLTQLYDGRDMYNLLHKEQLHVSALYIGHLQVDK